MPLTLTCLHPRVSAISAPIPTCQADGHGGSKAWSAAAFPQDDRRRPWQHAPGVNGSANARRLPPLELAENPRTNEEASMDMCRHSIAPTRRDLLNGFDYGGRMMAVWLDR